MDSLVYDLSHNLLYAGAVGNSVYKYNGSTWTDTAGGATPNKILSLAYVPKHDLLYAGTWKTFTTGDGVWMYDGATWTNIGGKVSSYGIPCLTYDSSHNLLYAGTVGHGVWKYDAP
jgi:hypothetical protein